MVRDADVAGMTVADLMRHESPTIAATATLGDAVDMLVASPSRRVAYVLDDEKRPVGAVSFRSVLRAVNARLGARAAGPGNLVRFFRDIAADSVSALMRPAARVQASTPLPEALEMMEELKENDLAVVDADGRIVGELCGIDVLELARDAVHRGDAASHAARQE